MTRTLQSKRTVVQKIGGHCYGYSEELAEKEPNVLSGFDKSSTARGRNTAARPTLCVKAGCQQHNVRCESNLLLSHVLYMYLEAVT